MTSLMAGVLCSMDAQTTWDWVGTEPVGGNLLRDGNHTYAYDAENRITQVDSGSTATYLYDALGNRVEKTVGATAWPHNHYSLAGA
jgi:YD repeat-containing protein